MIYDKELDSVTALNEFRDFYDRESRFIMLSAVQKLFLNSLDPSVEDHDRRCYRRFLGLFDGGFRCSARADDVYAYMEEGGFDQIDVDVILHYLDLPIQQGRLVGLRVPGQTS